MSDVLIECEASPGVFSDEVVVQVAGREFLVPKDRVAQSNGTSTVKAQLVSSADGDWVVLPTEYRDVVNKGQVKVAKA